jgi:hypothetical protein
LGGGGSQYTYDSKQNLVFCYVQPLIISVLFIAILITAKDKNVTFVENPAEIPIKNLAG